MTWQGGKRRLEVEPRSPFAPLKPLAEGADDAAKALESLSGALRDYPRALRLDIRLLADDREERIEHWEVEAGSTGARAERREPKDADVIVVMRPETWMEIAQGRLAPYDAVYSGRVRVGGDLEAAKELTEFLTDPATPYVPPC